MGWVIGFTSGLLLLYTLSPWLGFNLKWVFLLFFSLNVLLIFTVVTILLYGQPSGKTFDQTWYDDMN